ncbi:NACHT domain-containing protein [Mycobacterium kyogaense]|uniref:NACHT domain-containing protein n=1 Tax=Mycobacterium kyogaense TaxID=2212479 RepID=UPI0013C42A64|nr:hypothetical protein [Mycobacterium kyogaense]
MIYDLTRLGSKRFEHLAQALAIANLGAGVTIFGSGPDGGREATFDGPVSMEGSGDWDGYGVVQAKYKEQLAATASDQSWFFQQVTAELDAWVHPKSKRRRKPEYLLIVTNVTLSAVAHSGGLDRIDALFTYYRDLKEKKPDGSHRKIGLPGLRGYHVWHADHLNRLLDGNSDIRTTYADLILPGDVISRLYEQVAESDQRVAHAWITHVSRTLRNDTAVELGESGDSNNTPLPLAEIAVDLPASFSPRKETPSLALKTLVERGDQVLSPALRPASRDRIVVLGGPGSGKSTLSKLLCQLYRVALVHHPPTSGRVLPQVATQADQIRSEFDNEGLPHPTLHRLPVRVVLSKFADAVTRSRTLTLLQHIVEVINERSSDPITVAEAKRLITAWPLLVVLDGMDEVASAENRREVSSRVSDFLIEMAAIGSDVLTVCTSRPVGFELDSDINYEELHLSPLTTDDAMHYASRLLSCKFATNPDRKEQTLQRLQEATRTVDTVRLMTSPLQVTILTLLLEQRRVAPASRYGLFSSYYDTIYARECNKPEGIGDVLEMYRSQFDQLHEQCGLAIHARAEQAGAAESVLPLADLEQTARGILQAEGYPETDTDSLIPQVLRLAQQRLVLLVPRMAGVAFEIRSLAEFFAARCLMATEDAATNLEVLVPSAHWRHTWLLAAGQIFAQRRELRDAVMSRLLAADHVSAVNRLVMPGSVLAIEALDDGFAATAPRFEQDLVVAALRLLKGPIGSHIMLLGDALAPFMQRLPLLEQTVWREIEALLADHSPGATRAFLSHLSTLTDYESIALRANNRLTEYTERHPSNTVGENSDHRSDEQRIRANLIAAGLIPGDHDDPRLLHTIAGRSTDGSDADLWLRQAREIVVDGCQDGYSLRSKLRASLAEAIEHDSVAHLLLVPAPYSLGSTAQPGGLHGD